MVAHLVASCIFWKTLWHRGEQISRVSPLDVLPEYGASNISNTYTSNKLTCVVYSTETDVSNYWHVPIPTVAASGANRRGNFIKGKYEALFLHVSALL